MTPQFRDWVDKARAVHITATLAVRKIELRGRGRNLQGPCPNCGGVDRFAVDTERQLFNCRQCGIRGHGSISLVQAIDGCIFVQAVETITGEPPPGKAPKTAKPRNGRELGKLVSISPYTDELGDELYQVLRYDPKDFRQRRPDPDRPGEYITNLDGCRLVPYHLGDVIEAIETGHTVYLVEGEKDADNGITKLGVMCTTTAMGTAGSGAWERGVYDEFFRDADVVLVPDQDGGKGASFAQVIGKRLREVANRIRVLTLPCKDLSVWIEQGGTAEAFELLVVNSTEPFVYINGGNGNGQTDGRGFAEAMPPFDPGPLPPELAYIDMLPWDRLPAPVRHWAVLNRIPAENVTLLSGDGGLGKTLLMLQLAVATVLGRECLDMLPTPGPVMIVSAEDDEKEFHTRLDTIARHYGTDFKTLVASGLHLVSLVGKDTALAIAGPNGLVRPTQLFETIRRDAARIKPAWIAFDTAADVFIVEERDRSQARQCINLLRGLAVTISTAVLLLSHPSRAGIREGDGQSGSTGWNNSVRSRLYLYRPDDEEDGEPVDPNVSVLEVMKANYAARGEKVTLRWDNWMLTLAKGQIAPATAYDKATADRLAHQVFKRLLEYHNSQDITASATIGARNYAPTMFAKMPDAVPLHAKPFMRKRILADAMHALLKAGEVKIGQGPLSLRASKRSPCLYITRLHPDTDPQQRLL